MILPVDLHLLFRKGPKSINGICVNVDSYYFNIDLNKRKINAIVFPFILPYEINPYSSRQDFTKMHVNAKKTIF
jgi:hypothetical protein